MTARTARAVDRYWLEAAKWVAVDRFEAAYAAERAAERGSAERARLRERSIAALDSLLEACRVEGIAFHQSRR